MSACEQCGRAPRFNRKRRFRCIICRRMLCDECCEAIDRTQGQRNVWCLPGTKECKEVLP